MIIEHIGIARRKYSRQTPAEVPASSSTAKMINGLHAVATIDDRETYFDILRTIAKSAMRMRKILQSTMMNVETPTSTPLPPLKP